MDVTSGQGLNGMSKLSIAIFGNTNNYPLLLAEGLRSLGLKVRIVLNRKKLLHRPGVGYPELTKAGLDRQAFLPNSIRLKYKIYDCALYPQLCGAFAGATSVLNWIANCGSQLKASMRSRTPNRIVIP